MGRVTNFTAAQWDRLTPTRAPLVDDRDALLDRVSLEAVLEQVVGPGRHRMWPCPSPTHAQTGRTPPVSVTDDRLWRCHGCGIGGTAVDVLVVAFGVSVGEAFERLRNAAGLERRPEPPRPARKRPAIDRPPPPDAAARLADWTGARGWTPNIVDAFGLAVVRDAYGQPRPRVRFPFRIDGARIWHQDRAMGNGQPKYLSPAGGTQQVYALDLAHTLDAAHHTGRCWLVEGLPDVVALGHLANVGHRPAAFGLPGVGYARLPELAAALGGLSVAVVADADPDGEGMRERAGALLDRAGADVIQVRLPGGVNDLDDLRRLVGCDDARFAAALGEAIVAATRGRS